ncbi:GIY-YIG nuclease family protein [Formosa algae]|uniref:GIY-YIG nuclease family protein n=1 Tax=Formosa algae TaxID=225843 RepID=UPI000CCE8392|nr:GIY-YIG nuclease family protein [Formosa algae]PNW25385.1 methionine sulfoxide reductase [Formosa algae]|tara:strand:- start:31 stop:957 length:927 start_codon:yes stop_codon:yes gene_type:complete
MTLGKSIRIYLKEGSVTGIKLAEVVNLTIQALSSPRKKLSELNEFFQNQINTQGVYFLIGTDDETGKSKVYIGEGENVWERLKSHAVKKDFWSEVVLFTSKDDNITKSHIKYLESRLIEITKETERYLLENSNSPSLNSLPLPDRDAMEEFINNIKLLNGVLGHKFLESQISYKTEKQITPKDNIEELTTVSEDDETELNLKVKNITAKAVQTDEGIVVLAGSQVSENPSENFGYKTLRNELIEDGTIQETQNGPFVFTKKHLFSSPSAAAAVIVGYSINGRRTWKDYKGRTLSQIEKLEIKTAGNTV